MNVTTAADESRGNGWRRETSTCAGHDVLGVRNMRGTAENGWPAASPVRFVNRRPSKWSLFAGVIARLLMPATTSLPAIDQNIRHGVPGVVQADEKEQECRRSDREKRKGACAGKADRGRENGKICRQRQDGMEQPVLEYR